MVNLLQISTLVVFFSSDISKYKKRLILVDLEKKKSPVSLNVLSKIQLHESTCNWKTIYKSKI